MHELDFADSAIQEKTWCLGLPLRPYSIGHELALLNNRSPLLMLSPAGFDELSAEQARLSCVRAVDICSMTWAEIHFTPRTWLERRKYAKVHRKWAKHLKSVVWQVEIAGFRGYLDAGRKLFKTLSHAVPEDAEAYEVANKGEKLEGGRTLGSPLIAQLITFATNQLGMSYIEAMDAPFSLVGNLYFAHLESKGAMAIENYKESEERAELARLREEVRKEKEAAKAAWESAKTHNEKLAAISQHERIIDMFPEAAELKGSLWRA